MRAVASWSGGKDSCLAYHKAVSEGVEILYLLNFINADGSRSMSHGVSPELIANQAAAIGVPVVQRRVTWATYEATFKEIVAELKGEGVEGVVTGDIDLAEGRAWNDRMGAELGVRFISPLWGMEPEGILNEFIAAGFKAVVVCLKAGTLAASWIGRELDGDFIGDLRGSSEVHLCGELGEYHTLVTDGPIFRERIEILDSRPVFKGGYWFLDIPRYRMKAKRR